MCSPDFTVDNKIFSLSLSLYGNICDFSVDYSAITNDEILDIHKYLVKKNNIV